MWINKQVGYLHDWITQFWVKATGRRFDPEKESWLTGPIGDTQIISDRFINTLAAGEDLDIHYNVKDSGLLDDFADLGITREEQALLHPRVRDFYERTVNYDFEIWSEWCGFFRPFGWMLSVIFSKRLQQLNLPLSALDAAKGINSNVIKLKDKTTGATRWTIWFRKLKSTNHVIYAGVYSTCDMTGTQGRYMKVVFPLPNGNATVIMKKEVLPDGALKLSSDGQKFGDNGFYFTLTDHRGRHWARFVRSMHEWITVYVDEEAVLRADHHLHFYGLPFLKLHYKMTRKHSNRPVVPAGRSST